MKPEHINPAGLKANPAFSQAVVAHGPGRLIFVGGQNALSATGEIVGSDLYTQSRQALQNVLTALAAVGATQEDVVRLGIYMKAGEDAAQGYQAAGEVWGRHATAITVLQVAGFAGPAFLVEIEATAFLAD
jgi:2-iminobutanoate/2-iminopropanoate deaminase